ncbi:MAG TPA: NADP-dependent malic enzyme [Thermoanaerobaculia bacterium]|nr:NADP-dependent malic enzyme [Thermoanaerobaculia bacterium]
MTREEALEYHSRGRKGKVEVVPSKPCRTQEDLSLAYSPGVAEPCLEIARDPETIYDYTAKGNLVAVISNGTAVLGLGDIGPLAAKPVMEGKGVLFKRFADIDVFDIEVDAKDPTAFIDTVARIAPTFGGINLEDVKAPECFVIEEELRKRLKIPVFHDDQHGTAIISAAALLNALEIAGKEIGDVKVVFLGAGASAIACARLYLSYGVQKENLRMVDKSGVIYAGRAEDTNPYKAQFAVETRERTLADALEGADVLVGLSSKGLVKGEMLKRMAKDPIVFALANPDPEIMPEEARAARPDVIMATGRSDYPNQVNNVLGFPFIFRGALDVRATEINEAMKKAASQALAALAKMDVPDSVSKAYRGQEFRFGREYLIPKPFDFRVLLWVAPAVAEAAIASGVAHKPITDLPAYLRRLEAMLSRTREVMGVVIRKASQNPKRIVFPEGEHPKILRAAKILVEEGICRPILLARIEEVEPLARELQLPIDQIEFVHSRSSPRLPEYARLLEKRRRRRGMTVADAAEQAGARNMFGPLMVEAGDADGVISGLTQHYPETIRPALQIVGTAPGVRRVSGLYALIFKDRTFFFADTTVNIEPTAEDLAEIALLTADAVRRFDFEPRIAMISFSNFGSNTHANALKVKRAVELVKAARPDLPIDGEMQADYAVVPELLEAEYPWATVRRPNVLIFPDLQSANAAYKLVSRLAGAEAIGPILMGMRKPVHVLQREVEVADIVNMAAIAVVDAQEKEAKVDTAPALRLS